MGAGSPKHVSRCYLLVLGSLFWRGRSPRMVGAIAAPGWGVGSHDTTFLPRFPGGQQPVLPMASAAPSQAPSPVIAKLPSCQGATILSAARGHAELRTEGELAQQPGSSCMGAEMPACPRPGQLCWASVPQVSPTIPHIWAGCPSPGHVPAYIMCLLRYPIMVCQQVHPALVPGSWVGRCPQGLLQVPTPWH